MRNNLTKKNLHLMFCMLMLAALTFSVNRVKAQNGVGINGTGAAADPSAGLDVDYPDKGVLIPRVSLIVTSLSTPITNPVTGLLVYNKETQNDVAPGFYYWNGTLWVPITPNIPGDVGITCGVGNLYYTLRGDGNGGYVCTNTLQVAPGYVGVNIAPSSSYRLRVSGTTSLSGSVYVGGAFGSSFNSSGDLSMSSNSIAGSGTVSIASTVTVNRLEIGSFGVTLSSTSLSMGGGSISGVTTLTTSGSINAGGSVTASSLRASGTISSGGSVTFSMGSGSGSPVVSSSGSLRTTTSTIRAKENIHDYVVNKDKLFKTRLVSYNYKKAIGGDPDMGVIAEELAKLTPEAVIWGPKRIWPDNSGLPLKKADGLDSIADKTSFEPYSVKYDRFGLMLVPIVKEQDEMIQKQQQELADLKKRLEVLEKLVAAGSGNDPSLKNTGAILPKENPTLEAEAILPKK